jgi:hypothetical protein
LKSGPNCKKIKVLGSIRAWIEEIAAKDQSAKDATIEGLN